MIGLRKVVELRIYDNLKNNMVINKKKAIILLINIDGKTYIFYVIERFMKVGSIIILIKDLYF